MARDPEKVKAARRRYEERHPERKSRLAALKPSRRAPSRRVSVRDDTDTTDTVSAPIPSRRTPIRSRLNEPPLSTPAPVYPPPKRSVEERQTIVKDASTGNWFGRLQEGVERVTDAYLKHPARKSPTPPPKKSAEEERLDKELERHLREPKPEIGEIGEEGEEGEEGTEAEEGEVGEEGTE
jgi:hypothetical protein